VYVGTLKPFYAEGANQIDVFNGELNSIEQEHINGHIASLGLPIEGVSNSLPTVHKRIVAGTEVIGGTHYVTGGDIIRYAIDLAAENPGDSPRMHNVAIIDNLPPELEYISSPSVNGVMGVYDPDFHAVTWLYPSLVLTAPLTVVLDAEVQSDVPPGRITNEAVVLSSGSPPLMTLADVFVGESSNPQNRAELTVYASELTGGNLTAELMCVLILPPQINLSQVARDVNMVLDPGGTEASYQIVYGRDGQVKITAFFDKAQLLAIIRDQNMTTVTLTVTGRLVDGEQFSGETTIPAAGNLR